MDQEDPQAEEEKEREEMKGVELVMTTDIEKAVEANELMSLHQKVAHRIKGELDEQMVVQLNRILTLKVRPKPKWIPKALWIRFLKTFLYISEKRIA